MPFIKEHTYYYIATKHAYLSSYSTLYNRYHHPHPHLIHFS